MRTLLTSTTLVFILLGCQAGCASKSKRVAPGRNPIGDRAQFVEQRAAELIRRGAPREQAVQKAAGEWFNQSLAHDRRAEDEQRAAQARIDAELAKMKRNGSSR